jgi:glycosyltransferase involved in cell wall biosynthesis
MVELAADAPACTVVLVKRFPKLSETFISGEIVSLLKHGHDVRVLSMWSPTEALRPAEPAELGGRVSYLDAVPRLVGALALARALLRRPGLVTRLVRLAREVPAGLAFLGALLERCERDGVRHIHCHYLTEPAALAAAAADALGATWSISAHAKDIYETAPSLVTERMAKAAFVVTCTRHNYDYLRGLAGDEARVHLVYHGVDADFFAPEATAPTPSAKHIVSVGRFKEKKGFDVLIRACALLAARGESFECSIVGYGDQDERLRALIAELGLEARVRLCAPMRHAEVRELLRGAALFVMPCRVTASGDRDGIPNSMLEAMASGVPVVATPVSGIPEVIVDGVNGMLVEPENEHALSEAMGGVLADELLGRRLARAARGTVLERFAWWPNVRRLSELLTSALPPRYRTA